VLGFRPRDRWVYDVRGPSGSERNADGAAAPTLAGRLVAAELALLAAFASGLHQSLSPPASGKCNRQPVQMFLRTLWHDVRIVAGAFLRALERAQMGEIVRFVPKAELERARLIRQAREIYESIFPQADAGNEPRDYKR